MEYKLIFTLGHQYDEDVRAKETRGDILLQTEEGEYYALNFITLDRIRAEFHAVYICYLEENMVILHDLTVENITKSVPQLHRWMFYKKWIPLSAETLEKNYMPRDPWVIYTVVTE